MGAPGKVFKPAKCKVGEKWVITERMGNDVYIRMKKSGRYQFVDSAGTIVAEKDIWFIHGFALQETLDHLIARKSIWDAACYSRS